MLSGDYLTCLMYNLILKSVYYRFLMRIGLTMVGRFCKKKMILIFYMSVDIVAFAERFAVKKKGPPLEIATISLF